MLRELIRRLVCGKCFRDSIAPAGTYHCVNHAISVMRLALGYSSGLPSDWFWPGFLMRSGADLFQRAFPKHKVHLFVPDDAVSDFPGAEPMSRIIHFGMDKYLWAFAYPVMEGKQHHFVIGLPTAEEGKIQAASVLAVSLENHA